MGEIYDISQYGNNEIYSVRRENSSKRRTSSRPDELQVPSFVSKPCPQRNPNDPNKVSNQDGDTLESERTQRAKEARREERRRQAVKRAWMNRVVGMAMAAGIILGGAKVADVATSPHDNFNGAGHTYTEVSDWTDVDLNVLLAVNGLTTEDAESEAGDLILPEVYSLAGEEIKEVEEKLASGDLTEDEVAQLNEQLEELTAQKDIQDRLATVYTVEGSKWAYIVPKEDDTKIEAIKEANGIEDGVILKYNYSLLRGQSKYKYYRDDDGSPIVIEGRHSGYYDYTGATANSTDVIKVPKSALGAANEED